MAVLPSSGITKPADLAGKTVAVNLTNNIQTLTLNALNTYPSTLDPAEITKVLTLMKSGGLATGTATASSLLFK